MAESSSALPVVLSRRPRTFAISKVWRKPMVVVACVMLVALVATAFLLPLVMTLDPYAVHGEKRLAQPFTSGAFLGADSLGRDTFARMVRGTAISIRVAFISVLLGQLVGGVLGAISAYFPRLDGVIQRTFDLMLMIPVLILAMVLVAVRGQTETNVIIAIAVIQLPVASRMVRSVILAEKEADYVLAEHALGAGWIRILFFHLLPQAVGPWLVVATLGFGTAILVEAALSFLGVGLPAPTPSLGALLSGDTLRFVRLQYWNAILPGIVLTALIFSCNVIGDALGDYLDPRRNR